MTIKVTSVIGKPFTLTGIEDRSPNQVLKELHVDLRQQIEAETILSLLRTHLPSGTYRRLVELMHPGPDSKCRHASEWLK